MKILNHIIKQARANPRSIVLAEGDDVRVIEAAVRATADGIASCILIGKHESIRQQAAAADLKLDNIEIEDPETSDRSPIYAQLLFELREHKGMTPELARQQVLDPLCFADLMLKNVEAICCRVEHYKSENRFSTIVSRAFTSLAAFFECSHRLLAPEGILLAMKGPDPGKEISDLSAKAVSTRIIPLVVPGVTGGRSLVEIVPKR